MPVGFSRKIFPEMYSCDKWLDLTAGQAFVWWYLISGEHPTKCGIIPLSYNKIIAFSKGTITSREQVDEALQLFESPAYGWIRTDEKYIWVVDFIEDQGNSNNWITGALDEAHRLSERTHLGADCVLQYAESLGWKPYAERRSNGVKTPSKRRKDGIKTAPDGVRTASGRKGQGQSQILESTNVDSAADAAPSSKLDQVEKPYSEADLEVANWIIKVVETVAEHGGFEIQNPRTPQAIASGVHKSGLQHSQIRDTFQWARQNSFQRGGLVNLVRWTKGEFYVDLYNKWRKSQEIEQDQSGGLLPLIGD